MYKKIKEKPTHLMCYFKRDQRDWLDKAAYETGLSLTELVRNGVQLMMDREILKKRETADDYEKGKCGA